MKTILLEEAADFLQMNPEVLRRKAKKGLIPGKKTGKKWVFVKEHLADWVSGRYPETGLNLRVVDQPTEEKPCQSTYAEPPGGCSSPIQTEKKYKEALGLE